jgi:hypothetical protein
MGIQSQKEFFYFQDANELNGIHVPFRIKIQTPMQVQPMSLCSYNGVISMDATFGTNNVKFNWFTSMVCYHIISECQWLRSSQVDKNVRIWWND